MFLKYFDEPDGKTLFELISHVNLIVPLLRFRMTSSFEIKEHVLECQHIREYAKATSTFQEDVLYLSIKQYTPIDNPEPQEGDVTIIGGHANGFPKVFH